MAKTPPCSRHRGPGGPVAKMLCSQCMGPVVLSVPMQGTISHMPQLKIPHAATQTEDPMHCN